MDTRQVRVTGIQWIPELPTPKTPYSSRTVPWLLGELFLGVTLLQLGQVTAEVTLALPLPQLASSAHVEVQRRPKGQHVQEMGTEGRGLSTYPSQAGGGPRGHGQTKHSKTKYKRQQNTEVKKTKTLVKHKCINRSRKAKDSLPHFSP